MVTLYGQEEVFRDYVASQKFSSEVKGIVELSRELGRSLKIPSLMSPKSLMYPMKSFSKKSLLFGIDNKQK